MADGAPEGVPDRAPDGGPASGAVGAEPLPAFVNPRAGSAAAARAAIDADRRFALREVSPARLAAALADAAAAGHRRVVVSGGDGTVATAAAAAADRGLELAVLPGGTLNHFARDLGLPLGDLAACLTVAAAGRAVPADLGTVNGRAFLNTSAVGAYVTFVRTRERLERWAGYRAASALAAARVWLGLNAFTVVVREGERAGDAAHLAASPLVFVGVGERDLSRAGKGARVRGGRSALHAVVVRAQSRAGVLALVARAAAQGLEALADTEAVDVLLVDACEVHMRRPRGRVAVDGELVVMTAPLGYRLVRGAFRVVVPDDYPGEGGAGGGPAGVRT